MSYLIDFLEDILVWLKDLLLWLPRKLYELILDGLATVFEAIPVPDWMEDGEGFFAAISPDVVYFLDDFKFVEGFQIVLAAYLLRFLIRRIPIVG